MSDVILRPLNPSDCELLYKWRNDPWIVSLSASQRTVDLREHQAWFAEMLLRNDILIRIITNECGQDMGLVKIAREHKTEATITVYLLQPYIGKKRGPQTIREACALAFSQWQDLRKINAWIRSENIRSIVAFSRIGFKKEDHVINVNPDGGMIKMSLMVSTQSRLKTNNTI